MKIRTTVENYKIILTVLSELGYDITCLPYYNCSITVDASIPFAIVTFEVDRVARYTSKVYFDKSEVQEYKLEKTLDNNKVIYELVEAKKEWIYEIRYNKCIPYVAIVDAHDKTFIGWAINLESQETISGLKETMEKSNYNINSLQFDYYDGALIIK